MPRCLGRCANDRLDHHNITRWDHNLIIATLRGRLHLSSSLMDDWDSLVATGTLPHAETFQQRYPVPSPAPSLSLMLSVSVETRGSLSSVYLYQVIMTSEQ